MTGVLPEHHAEEPGLLASELYIGLTHGNDAFERSRSGSLDRRHRPVRERLEPLGGYLFEDFIPVPEVLVGRGRTHASRTAGGREREIFQPVLGNLLSRSRDQRLAQIAMMVAIFLI